MHRRSFGRKIAVSSIGLASIFGCKTIEQIISGDFRSRDPYADFSISTSFDSKNANVGEAIGPPDGRYATLDETVPGAKYQFNNLPFDGEGDDLLVYLGKITSPKPEGLSLDFEILFFSQFINPDETSTAQRTLTVKDGQSVLGIDLVGVNNLSKYADTRVRVYLGISPGQNGSFQVDAFEFKYNE